MKRTIYGILVLMLSVLFVGCNDYETYSDMKKKERSAINRFLADSAITVIKESTFEAQGQTTNLSRNEYVYLEKSGVYMQIVRKGCGNTIEEGRNVNVLCRFSEYNIKQDSLLVCNNERMLIYSSSIGQYIDASQYVDKMSVVRTGSTFTAVFVSGMMSMYHSSTSVPPGWLVPLLYVNIGRPQQDGDQTAKVKLIVPHSQGTADASQNVYPCYYEIEYQREN